MKCWFNMYRSWVFLRIFTFSLFVSKSFSEIPLPNKSEQENLSAYPKYGVSYRLPNTSLPLAYDIAINWTDDETFNFNGRVRIECVIVEYTSTLVIHKRFIDIENVILSSLNSNEQEFPVSWTYSNITDFLTISFNENFDIGSRILLDITYSGKLRRDNRGFFYQFYIAKTGERRQIFFKLRMIFCMLYIYYFKFNIEH